jgi:hypothetical protein
METSNQRGRGNEPVVVLGSVSPAVAVNMDTSYHHSPNRVWARFGREMDSSIRYHRSNSMKQILPAILFAASALAQGSPPHASADAPYAMEYYYKTQWGHQQEFLQLFLKNHYPLLQKLKESGRVLSVKIETPANHLPEDARWDYRVTIRFKNSTLGTTTNPAEDSLIKQLWPDQETYKREEQRRFEILLAHWDVPVTDITPTQ